MIVAYRENPSGRAPFGVASDTSAALQAAYNCGCYHGAGGALCGPDGAEVVFRENPFWRKAKPEPTDAQVAAVAKVTGSRDALRWAKVALEGAMEPGRGLVRKVQVALREAGMHGDAAEMAAIRFAEVTPGV